MQNSDSLKIHATERKTDPQLVLFCKSCPSSYVLCSSHSPSLTLMHPVLLGHDIFLFQIVYDAVPNVLARDCEIPWE